jgi:hypothetical protein
VLQGDVAAISQKWLQIDNVESVQLVSEGPTTAAYDLTLLDEAGWLSVMEAVHTHEGRLETYRRVDDQSLRQIVAHFSSENTDSGSNEVRPEQQID